MSSYFQMECLPQAQKYMEIYKVQGKEPYSEVPNTLGVVLSGLKEPHMTHGAIAKLPYLRFLTQAVYKRRMLSKSVSPFLSHFWKQNQTFHKGRGTELFLVRWMPDEPWESVESVESGKKLDPGQAGPAA